MIMRLKSCFAFLITLQGLCLAQNFQKRLSEFDQIKNDSAAYVSLQNFLQNNKLDIPEQLQVNYRIVVRAYSLQKYTSALTIANENLVLAEDNGSDSMVAVFNKVIGITNYYMDQKKMALPYFEKALQIAKDHGYWELEASCNNNLGGALTDLLEYQKAEPYLLRSIAIMKEHGKEDHITTLRTYRVLARMFSESGQEQKAEPLYLSLIEKARSLKDTAFLCDNLLFYAHNLSRRGEAEKAVQMSAEALAYRQTQNNFQDLYGAMTIHSRNLLAAGREKEAFALMDKSGYMLRDNFKKNLEKEISEVEVKYKTAQIKREKEIAEENTKQQKQIYLLTFLGILLLIGGGIFTWNQRKTLNQKARLAEVEKQRFKDVIEAEEKERSRIAQELHDGLGQLLSTARLNVAGLEDAVSSEDQTGIERSLKIIDAACMEVRNISHNMMPSALMRLGLLPAINEMVHNVNSAKGVQIKFTTNMEVSPERSLDISIYRVIQEILNNMIKHAKATQIELDIQKLLNTLTIHIKDNGVGFNTDDLDKSKGIGWKNIYSRISMLNGHIKLTSELQKGTRVFISLNIKDEQ
jgi:two-component system, NarL family, sensor kinase